MFRFKSLCVVATLSLLGSFTFADVTAPDAKVEKLAGDFQFTEGCTSDKDGNVYFVDQPNNAILKWDVTKNELSTFMKPSNYSNGMTFTADGKLVACADEKNEMWLIDPATKEHTVLFGPELDGKLFNAPNDVWEHPTSKRLYFTDPFYRRTWWSHRADRMTSEMPQCVYYYDPATKKVVRVIDDFQQPNGIIGTPDGKKLYVADIRARKTWQYDIQEDGSLGNKQPFCDVGSDGMTIDADGNVYLSSRTVQVFDKEGKKVQDIQVPEGPANMCFGGADMKTLFITARTGLYAVKMQVKGAGPQ